MVDDVVGRLDDYMQILEKEVNIDFCRSMNRIIFDKTVLDDPETFAFVTLPDAIDDNAPEKGKTKMSLILTEEGLH